MSRWYHFAGASLSFVLLALMSRDRNQAKQGPMQETPEEETTTERQEVVRIARSQLGNTDWRRYLDDGNVAADPNVLVAWCGIFALWVLHQAGLTDWRWVYGAGFLYKLPRTVEPKPGDMAYIDQPYQHHAIVAEVDGDEIVTIDGNSAGGKVALNRRPRSAFSGFYSIAPLIAEKEHGIGHA